MDYHDSKMILDWNDVEDLTEQLADLVASSSWGKDIEGVYGIPVGGCFVAKEVARKLNVPLHSIVKENTLVVDDIVDSGKTIAEYVPGIYTAALLLKEHAKAKPLIWVNEVPTGCWVVFPWEKKNEIEDSVRRIIEFIGEDPTREGLLETPKRVSKSWGELYKGYKSNPKEILQKCFTDHGKYDQMIILRNVEFFSMCEHHMLPFYGTVSIGYIPKDRVVGVSKLARIVEVFARRLQIQERMTQEIASLIDEVLQPLGVGVIVEATHMCMQMRGVNKRQATMITSAIRGTFCREEVREEFMRLVKGQ